MLQILKQSHTWIEDIRSDPDRALKNIYQEERSFCLSWMRKHTSLSDNDQIEIFQSAVVILYDNIMNGKLTEAKSKLSSYLISICKNKSQEVHRRHSKHSGSDSITDSVIGSHVIDGGDEKVEKEEKINAVAQILLRMGAPCKTIIELYYYQKMSMVDIGQLMAYKNVDTVKNQKYKCMQRLRKQTQSI